jgi:hypothetical protein
VEKGGTIKGKKTLDVHGSTLYGNQVDAADSLKIFKFILGSGTLLKKPSRLFDRMNLDLAAEGG